MMEIYRIAEQKMNYFNYSTRTIEVYVHYIQKFIEHTGKHHSRITAIDFQNYLNGFKFSSISQQNQVINAIIYTHVSNQLLSKVALPI